MSKIAPPAQKPSVGQPFNPFRIFRGIWIPEALVGYPRISEGAKLLYGQLCRHAGEDGKCYPAQRTLASELGISERHLRNRLSELKEEAFISACRRYDHRGNRLSDAYRFLWHPIFDQAYRNNSSARHRKDCPATQRKRSSGKESHHQEGRCEENQPNVKFVESGTRGLPKKQEASLLRADDEKAKTYPEHMKRPPASTPEQEFRARIQERHGDAVDAQRLLRHVKADLNKEGICVSLEAFLDFDLKNTTAPGKLQNPAGHYRKLARELVNHTIATHLQHTVDLAAAMRTGVIDQPTEHCKKCLGTGRLADDQFCDCAMGRDLERVERRRANQAAQTASSGAAA